MDAVLLTTEYFGPMSSYWHIGRAARAYVETHENYQKKSYRNRCKILSPNGTQLLSVPLTAGKNNRCPISEVGISYAHDWIDEHSQALLSSYSKAPYYEYYMPDIEAIWNKKIDRLLDLNTQLQTYVMSRLSIDTQVSPTTGYTKKDEVSAGMLDLRQQSYTSRTLPTDMQLQYTQVWYDRFDFEADLSILDLLFCKGPEAGYYL